MFHAIRFPFFVLDRVVYAGNRISAQLLWRNATPICISNVSCSPAIVHHNPSFLFRATPSPPPRPTTISNHHLPTLRQATYSEHSNGRNNTSILFVCECVQCVLREAGLGVRAALSLDLGRHYGAVNMSGRCARRQMYERIRMRSWGLQGRQEVIESLSLM